MKAQMLLNMICHKQDGPSNFDEKLQDHASAFKIGFYQKDADVVKVV